MKKETSGIQVIARAAAILRALGREGMSLGALAKHGGAPSASPDLRGVRVLLVDDEADARELTERLVMKLITPPMASVP